MERSQWVQTLLEVLIQENEAEIGTGYIFHITRQDQGGCWGSWLFSPSEKGIEKYKNTT